MSYKQFDASMQESTLRCRMLMHDTDADFVACSTTRRFSMFMHDADSRCTTSAQTPMQTRCRTLMYDADADFRCRRQSDARLVDEDDLRCTTSITANARRPRCLLSMPTHDARRRCKTSVHHARCTMHRRCITTT